jgi:peptidyl-tRNA hydrolase
MTLRLYAVVRQDLEMTSGKIAAQAGHAYLNAFLKTFHYTPQIALDYQKDGIGTKICLAAKQDLHLLQLQTKLNEAGVASSLITDSGHVMLPKFDGSPIITALGFGPCTREQVYSITRDLKLI